MIVVLRDEFEGVIYTWDNEVTLQAWKVFGGKWIEIDIKTLSNIPKDFNQAYAEASAWQKS